MFGRLLLFVYRRNVGCDLVDAPVEEFVNVCFLVHGPHIYIESQFVCLFYPFGVCIQQ